MRSSLYDHLSIALYALDDIVDGTKTRPSSLDEWKGLIDALGLAWPSEWHSEIEAANRLHAATTGPVREGRWLAQSWVQLVCDIACAALESIESIGFDGAEEAYEEVRELFPGLDLEWLRMCLQHDCRLIEIEPTNGTAPRSRTQVIDNLSPTQDAVFRAVTNEWQSAVNIAGTADVPDAETRRALPILERFGLIEHRRGFGYRVYPA
jgi:hypothetical protein